MNTQSSHQLNSNYVQHYVKIAEKILRNFIPSEVANADSLVKVASALIDYDIRQANQLDELNNKNKTNHILFTSFFDELGKIV